MAHGPLVYQTCRDNLWNRLGRTDKLVQASEGIRISRICTQEINIVTCMQRMGLDIDPEADSEEFAGFSRNPLRLKI